MKATSKRREPFTDTKAGEPSNPAKLADSNLLQLNWPDEWDEHSPSCGFAQSGWNVWDLPHLRAHNEIRWRGWGDAQVRFAALPISLLALKARPHFPHSSR